MHNSRRDFKWNSYVDNLTHMISLPDRPEHQCSSFFFCGGSIHPQCTENVDVCVLLLFNEIHIKMCPHCSMIVVHFIPFKDSQIRFFVTYYGHV
jgi:hypothetical protein